MIEIGDKKVTNVQEVSSLKWVTMEEKWSEIDNPSINVKINIENHNNVHFQRGYSRLIGHPGGPLAL